MLRQVVLVVVLLASVQLAKPQADSTVQQETDLQQSKLHSKLHKLIITMYFAPNS